MNARRLPAALFFCALLVSSCAGERRGGEEPPVEVTPPVQRPAEEAPPPVQTPPVQEPPAAGETPGAEPAVMLEKPPKVRVLILESRRGVKLRIPSAFSVGSSDRAEPFAEFDRGAELTLRPEGGEAVLVDGKRRVLSSEAITVRPAAGEIAYVNGKPYRGSMLFRATGGAVTVINVIEIDDYIKGVLPSEMGYLKPNQYAAFCAQAIAARSYALSKLEEKKDAAYDLNATVMDQVYTGVLGEHETASRAVDETRGFVCTFLGLPVRAYYSACCGGHTADVRVGWPWKTPYPYLYGVRDTLPGSEGGSLCRESKHFRWRVRWSAAALGSILRRTLPEELGIDPHRVGKIEDLRVLGTAPDGRAMGIEIATDRGKYQVQGDRVRWVLRPDPDSDAILKSTLFKLEVSRLGDRVASVDMLGGGNGHGIGMCQTGAIRMAELGYSPVEILRHYYPGAKVQRLYR